MSKIKLEECPEISAQMISDVIDNWVIGRNAERNRAILKRYYIDGICVDGKSAKTLTNEFKMSRRHIQTVIYKYEITIFKHLGLY